MPKPPLNPEVLAIRSGVAALVLLVLVGLVLMWEEAEVVAILITALSVALTSFLRRRYQG